MSGTVSATRAKNHEENGVVCLTQTQFRDFFDQQARDLVGLSGDIALERIRSGRAGSNLAWTELSLLSVLFRGK